MKECTVIYTVEITEIFKCEFDETMTDKRWIETHLKEGTLHPDDVKVKGKPKVFEREL